MLPPKERYPASEFIYLRVEGCSLGCQGMCAALEGANLPLYALHLISKLVKAVCTASQVLRGWAHDGWHEACRRSLRGAHAMSDTVTSSRLCGLLNTCEHAVAGVF